MVTMLSKKKFVTSIFDHFKIFLEASSISTNTKTFLVTNDKQFFMTMLSSQFFYRKVISPCIRNILHVHPAHLKLATDVVSDMP